MPMPELDPDEASKQVWSFFFSLDIMRSGCNGTAIFQLSRRWLHTFERNASVKRQLNSLAVSYKPTIGRLEHFRKSMLGVNM